MTEMTKGKLWCRSLKSAALAAAFIVFVSPAFAQQASRDAAIKLPPPAQQDPAAKPPQAADDKSKSDQAKPPCDPAKSDCPKEKDRIFSLVPNYQSVTPDPNKPLPPLSIGGKFKLAAQGAFDPGEFILIGALAAEDQITTDPKSLGQG
jgi:hypothetical protein